MRRTPIVLSAVLLAAVLTPGAAHAAARPYRTVDLGTLGGTRSAAFALNDAGQVVGNSTTADGQTHAFLWSGGRMRDLGTLPGGRYSTAVDVNAWGMVAGNATDAAGSSRAVVWRNGKIAKLPPLSDQPYQSTYAVAVNDRGQVLGEAEDADGRSRRVIWQGSTVTDQGPVDPYANVVDLNNRGDVTGIHSDYDQYPCDCRAGVWRAGVLTDLGDFGNTDAWMHAFPTDLNNRGAIVGASATVDGSDHAFLWRDGVLADLGTLGGAGSRATALNDRNQVTGIAEVADQVYHPFLWQRGTMTDLTARGLVAGDLPEDINLTGEIVLTRSGRALLLR